MNADNNPNHPRDANGRPIVVGDVVAMSEFGRVGGVVLATFSPTIVYRRADGVDESCDTPGDLCVIASTPGGFSPPASSNKREIIVRELILNQTQTLDWPPDELAANTHALLDDVGRLIDALSVVEDYLDDDGRATFLEDCVRRRYVSLASELRRAAVGLVANALEIRGQQMTLNLFDGRPDAAGGNAGAR